MPLHPVAPMHINHVESHPQNVCSYVVNGQPFGTLEQWLRRHPPTLTIGCWNVYMILNPCHPTHCTRAYELMSHTIPEPSAQHATIPASCFGTWNGDYVGATCPQPTFAIDCQNVYMMMSAQHAAINTSPSTHQCKRIVSTPMDPTTAHCKMYT